MIDGLTGDPASCSELGGALRSHAARLLAVREEVVTRAARLRREAPAASLLRREAVGADLADRLDGDVRLLDAVVDRLDGAGAALQRYAQELAELAEEIRRLDASVSTSGLVLEGLRVVEPWGVLTTELAQERGRAQPELQRQADRLASRLGRARAVTARAMAEGTAALATATSTARTRSLR